MAAEIDPKDNTHYIIDLTYEQATATDTTKVVVELADENAKYGNITKLDGGNFGLGGSDWAKKDALKVDPAGGTRYATMQFTVTAEDTKADTKNYTFTVNVDPAAAQQASVKLVEKTGVDRVYKLTGSDDAYTLIVDESDASSLNAGSLKGRITAEGTAANLTTAIGEAKGENGVFTITFTGLNTSDEEYNQVITVTVRTATDEERAQWDLADIKADFPEGKRVKINVENAATGDDVIDALEAEVMKSAAWGSDVTVTGYFNSGADNSWPVGTNGTQIRIMSIEVTLGDKVVHEANLEVTINVATTR